MVVLLPGFDEGVGVIESLHTLYSLEQEAQRAIGMLRSSLHSLLACRAKVGVSSYLYSSGVTLTLLVCTSG